MSIIERLGACYMKQTSSPQGDIILSIKVEPFVDQLRQILHLSQNKEGWIDLRIVRNERPEGKKGYTHKLKPARNGSTKGE